MRIYLLKSTNSRLDHEKSTRYLPKNLGIAAELAAITIIAVTSLGNFIQRGIPFVHLDMLIIPIATAN